MVQGLSLPRYFAFFLQSERVVFVAVNNNAKLIASILGFYGWSTRPVLRPYIVRPKLTNIELCVRSCCAVFTMNSSTYKLPLFTTTTPPHPTAAIRSVVELIDFNAENNPSHLFCLQIELHNNDGKPALLRITYKIFQHMIKQCQNWIEDHIPEARQAIAKGNHPGSCVKKSAIAILVDSDLGLLVHLFALMGLGIPVRQQNTIHQNFRLQSKVVILSTKLSIPAIVSLLSQTHCKIIITSTRLESAVVQKLALHLDAVRYYTHLSYNYFLKSLKGDTQAPSRIAQINHYVADGDRNVLILHSSGTTGLPKAVPQSHRYLLNFAPLSSFDFDPSGLSQRNQTMSFSVLPLFHCYGLLAPMVSLSIGKPFAIPPSGQVPHATSTLKNMAISNARDLFIVPSILKDILDLPNESGVDALRQLDYVTCGGGLVTESVGNKLVASGVKLINGFGGTEVGSLGILQAPKLDRNWRFFRLRQDLTCTIKELTKYTPTQQTGKQYSLTVRPPGWTEDYVLADVFITSENDPEREFQPIQRTDSLIVLATGEKLQPYMLESMLCEQPNIKAALVFGSGQTSIGVLLEPSNALSKDEREKIKENVWPLIVRTCRKMDNQARMWSKDAIIILHAEQTFPRSAKGSVLREETYQFFKFEIDHVYAHLERCVNLTPSTENLELETNYKECSVEENSIKATDHTLEEPCANENYYDSHEHFVAEPGILDYDTDLENQLLDYIVHTIWRQDTPTPSVTDDLFKKGMDSQQATQLYTYIARKLPLRAKSLPKDFIYGHTTIAQIAAHIRGDIQQTPLVSARFGGFRDLMQQFVAPYSTASTVQPSGATILLTGGTGAIGSHLLARFASLTEVSQIIVLNRSSNRISRHKGAGKANGYIRQFKSNNYKGANIDSSVIEKIRIIESDTSYECLGLQEAMYGFLAASVTHIIHSAFQVDFLQRKEQFDDQYKAMQNLIQFALQCTSNPRFLFVSSIAVVDQYHATSPDAITTVPEQVFQPDWGMPSIGYGQAKLICEKLLETASTLHGLCSVVVRCGQVSGSSSNGFWNERELIPTMIHCSLRINALPALDGVST